MAIMCSTSDDESIREPTPSPLRKSSHERKFPSLPLTTQHRKKKRQKVRVSGTKNPTATVKKHMVNVETVEEPSSDDESE